MQDCKRLQLRSVLVLLLVRRMFVLQQVSKLKVLAPVLLWLRLMKVRASAADVSKNDTVKPHETSAWKQPASRRCSGAARRPETMWRGPITNPQITSCIAAAKVYLIAMHAKIDGSSPATRSVRVSTASGDTKMMQANAKSSPRLRPRTAKQSPGRSLGAVSYTHLTLPTKG